MSLEIEYDAWYTMAEADEVFNVLNVIAMGFSKYYLINEEQFGDAVRQYDFDGNTFYKAEQLWAEREDLA
jgi:hypothetical protein